MQPSPTHQAGCSLRSQRRVTEDEADLTGEGLGAVCGRADALPELLCPPRAGLAEFAPRADTMARARAAEAPRC